MKNKLSEKVSSLKTYVDAMNIEFSSRILVSTKMTCFVRIDAYSICEISDDVKHYGFSLEIKATQLLGAEGVTVIIDFSLMDELELDRHIERYKVGTVWKITGLFSIDWKHKKLSFSYSELFPTPENFGHVVRHTKHRCT